MSRFFSISRQLVLLAGRRIFDRSKEPRRGFFSAHNRLNLNYWDLYKVSVAFGFVYFMSFNFNKM